MATLSAQIQSLAGSVVESEIDQWCVDGARELINLFPPNLKEMCYAKNTFTSAAANSEAETIATQHISNVFAGDVQCREIHPRNKYKASDVDSIEYATSTDPVYYIEGGKINILPASSSGIYYAIADPSIDASAVSAISNFPNEAEYLVVLYAAIKVLQNKMNELDTVVAIDTTAIGAITTQLDKVDDIIVEASGKIDTYYTSIGDIDDTTELWDSTNKRFKAVRDALIHAERLIDNDLPNSAYDAYQNLADIDAAFTAIDAHLTDEEAILTNDPTSGDISTALGLIKNAIDQAAAACDHFDSADESIFGDEDTFLTSSSQLAKVKDALDIAGEAIDTGFTTDEDAGSGDASPYSAGYWLADEDTEMVQATLATAQTEIQRAQTEISHWNAIGDMRVKEIQAALSEADAYSREVQARLQYAQAYVNAANARAQEGQSRIAQLNSTLSVASQELQRGNLAIAEINSIMASYKIQLDGIPLYLQEATSYIAQAQGYIAEANTRMQRDSQKYQWYQSQQQKLQQDYNQGVTALIGAPATQQEGR